MKWGHGLQCEVTFWLIYKKKRINKQNVLFYDELKKRCVSVICMCAYCVDIGWIGPS